MDELSVFNRALNENKIKTLMGQGGKAFTAVESTGGVGGMNSHRHDSECSERRESC